MEGDYRTEPGTALRFAARERGCWVGASPVGRDGAGRHTRSLAHVGRELGRAFGFAARERGC
jgi:hypothetical protein